MAARYWCHMCSKMVNPNPIVDAEIKCPCCQSGFVEELSGETSSRLSEEIQEPEIDFGSDRAMSLWAPILLGMMNNPRRRRRFRRTMFGMDNEVNDGNNSNVDNHHHHHHRRRLGREIDLDRDFESLIGRRRRSSATIMQLRQGIRDSLASVYESSDRLPLVRPGLDHLLEHRIRNRTRPARKEAVENLPTVKIHEPLQCTVCLDDFDKGSEAKEMPCKHKFHIRCIIPWLELHSSCPVCRYQLPVDDETKVDDSVRPATLEIIASNENVEDDDDTRNDNGSQRRFSLPWPFSGLFSSSSSSSSST